MRVSANRWRRAQKKEADFWVKGVFETQMARVKNRYQSSVNQVGNYMDSDATVLEMGSGPTCLAQFFKKGYKVYLDPLMDTYKYHYSKVLPEDGLFIKGIGEKLPFKNACFQVVVSVNALDHMRNPGKVLDEIFRILKSGGYLLLGLFTHHAFLALMRKLAEKSVIFREIAHPHSFSKGDILKLLYEKRFTIISENCVDGRESIFSLHRRDHVIICQKYPKDKPYGCL